jgi:spore coat protein B
MKDGYLSSLVGRTVQVYKGGPDSNVGHLLDVNGDYLTLQKEDGEIIYYKTSHIKSISENSKIRFNSASNLYDTDNLFKCHNFTELAVNLKDQKIRINGKGPESRVGHLIDVNDDFFVIYTEKDGLIFYKQQHIKSISQVLASENQEEDEEKDNNASSEEGNEEEELTAEVYEYMKNTYEQISAKNTNDLLTNLKLTWIKINRKGPESIEGMLVDANEEFLVLVVNNEVLRIATYHVKNFSVSVKKSDEQSDEENTNNQNSNNQNSKETTSNNDNQTQQSYALPYYTNRRRRTGGSVTNPRQQYKNKNK